MTLFAVLPLFSWLLIPQERPYFESQIIDNQLSIGYGIATGDVDGDEKPDILLADKEQFVWYRNGDWKKFVMVENLTEYDHVCIAARDIDGDGKVEVAVGAQWNPNETSDTSKSGSVHYLIRPDDPTQRWTPVRLHHEPTVHRMRWVRASESAYHLVMLPLHGRGNKDGKGKGVQAVVYEMPEDPAQEWPYSVINTSMHLTHNMDVYGDKESESIYIAGSEGIRSFSYSGKWRPGKEPRPVEGEAFGEVRLGKAGENGTMLAGIEPMHGNILTAYVQSYHAKKSDKPERIILDEDLHEGHALAVADFMNQGQDQVVVGWRKPNQEGHMGIKLYIPFNEYWEAWNDIWIDTEGIACEDLTVADLNADGKPDIIAAGRSTHNLKVYWNKSE